MTKAKEIKMVKKKIQHETNQRKSAAIKYNALPREQRRWNKKKRVQNCSQKHGQRFMDTYLHCYESQFILKTAMPTFLLLAGSGKK